MSDEGGEGEHQEDDQEAHAAPDPCEVGINTAKGELTALLNKEREYEGCDTDIRNLPGTRPWPG